MYHPYLIIFELLSQSLSHTFLFFSEERTEKRRRKKYINIYAIIKYKKKIKKKPFCFTLCQYNLILFLYCNIYNRADNSNNNAATSADIELGEKKIETCPIELAKKAAKENGTCPIEAAKKAALENGACPIAAGKKAEEEIKAQPQSGLNGPLTSLKTETLKTIIYVLSALLVVFAVLTIAVSFENAAGKDDSSSMSYYWTKHGLELIPQADWSTFSTDEEMYLPYIANFPFPQDMFTDEQFDAWNSVIGSASYDDLLEQGVISTEMETLDQVYSSVPTLYADPIVVNDSLIDYRLHYAADIGSQDLVGKAIGGRLVNPAGRRLREHHYRFPDQCDAPPIALEVFLRLSIYQQIEAFFREEQIGLFHDLFPEVERREYDNFELNLARWYGERYAEAYVHNTNNWVYPLAEQNIDTYMLALGLDPHDTNEDPTTSVGLGNLVGRRITEWINDNDRLQRGKNFVDEMGLQQIDDEHPSPDWHQWQPALSGSNRFQGLREGIVTRQTFVAPSLGIFSFLYDNETDYQNLNLQDSVPAFDVSEAKYIERAEEFLEITASLTDEQKAIAELSNNKISGSVFLILAYVPLLKELTTDEEFPALYDEFSFVTSACGEYGAAHAVWRHKRTHLAGRPVTVLKELVARNPTFAADHPGAENFIPFINPAGDHPEHPSGSAAIYSAFAQAADDWFLDKFGFADASHNTGVQTFTIPAGKFYWADGPEEEITIEYENLNAWIEELPLSRVYGGVHFLEAGESGLLIGKEVGHACSRLLNRLNAGDLTATYTSPSREAIGVFNM